MNMNTFSTQISIVMIMTHSMLSIIVLNPKSILNDGFTGCTSILICKGSPGGLIVMLIPQQSMPCTRVGTCSNETSRKKGAL